MICSLNRFDCDSNITISNEHFSKLLIINIKAHNLGYIICFKPIMSVICDFKAHKITLYKINYEVTL